MDSTMTTQEPSDPRPALWNPNAAACWCFLFTPVFGALLHARNAKTLGRTDEAAGNWIWFYVSLVYLLIVPATIFLPGIPDAVFRACGLVLLLGWYFNVGKKQILYVKNTWGKDYVRKSWKIPLLAAFGALMVFVVSGMILGFLYLVLSGDLESLLRLDPKSVGENFL